MSSSDIQSTSSIKKQRRFPRLRWDRRNIFTSFRRCRSSKNKDASLESGNKTQSISEDLNNLENLSKKDTLALNNSFDTENNRRKSLQSSGMSVGSKYSVSSRSGTSVLECPLCLVTQPSDKFPQLMTCQHRSCQDCLRQYLSIEITESRVNLMCPECQEKLHPSDMREILKQEPHLLVKWEEFTLRRTLSVDPDCRWCPAPDCGYAVIAFGCASCPKLECKRPGCNTEFCYHCRQEWHPTQTCDSAHLQRTKQLRIRSNSVAYSQGSGSHDEIKPCPKCGALIVKMNDGSCNHMTCTVCEAEFCWLCLQEITDLHYLSPSGCTFWGKKPWSRKKKILWQLGLLVGAPLGIGLVACLAVPAIIVGLPIWVARKIMAQFHENRDVAAYKRNLLVATCVAGTVVLSPALAALAVGVGVPVMLLYVYGVVPFSLCRTGSYRLPTHAPGGSGMPALPMGFRIDLGGQNGQHGTSSPDGDVPSGSLNTRLGGINPSIGEASVGGMTMGSLNLSHESNLDKAGRLDPDVASTVAIAGASITGSISGISGQNGSYKIDLYPNSGKEVDQQSTQGSVGSGANFTSVQVHMSDNVSENSTSGHMTNVLPVKKSFSSRSLGAKRKTRHSKRSSMKDGRGKNGIDSHALPPVDDSPSFNNKNVLQSTTIEIPESSIENLPQSTAKETDCKLPQTAEESGSDVSSCGSQTALITTISQQPSSTKLTATSLEQPAS